MDRYPAVYSDGRGSEATLIENDGETLRVMLRGLEFTSDDFDSLLPAADATPDQLAWFTLAAGSLCSCRIECRIPVPMRDRGRRLDAALSVALVLGDPEPDGGIDREELGLVLEYDGRRVAGDGTSGWFEDELLSIQARLPEGVFIEACINCMYSDYSPYGHGLFGAMLCFRNIREEYREVRGKAEFWSVHARYDRRVQETYLCPLFERRLPGIGYRG